MADEIRQSNHCSDQVKPVSYEKRSKNLDLEYLRIERFFAALEMTKGKVNRESLVPAKPGQDMDKPILTTTPIH
uniref:Uncharacterized protein n=1 Tax=Candidatus Kentrum sp. TC TaxID=2126339 RepID=A0A450ZTX0_9GAMM|nr:MAG: hypothetical protein BECKTC1821F_GA0114240_10162 [Candidatus Kentron sp. TC]